MFYKNGKFDQEAAKQAYFDTMEKLGYPISDNLRENMWVTDFDLGDFPNVGMAGKFWAHENKHGVFGHEIILLPNQMLIEHAHVAQDGLPAKNECWQARAGTTYCFGETGEMDDTQLPEVKVPESQKNFITVHKVTKADSKKGNVVWLSRIGSFHYQIAGPEGARTNGMVNQDAGIAAQTIMLAARAAGLVGCMVASFDVELGPALGLAEKGLEPLVLCALGYPAPDERVVLEPATTEHGITYWRDADGVHHVPKLAVEDLLV